MAATKAKLTRDTKATCKQCGTKESVTHVYTDICPVCVTVNYLMFRHAMHWPLDEDTKKRLGL